MQPDFKTGGNLPSVQDGIAESRQPSQTVAMGKNKFAGVWFALGVVSLILGFYDNGYLAIVGVLFIITAYIHEGLLALVAIEQNTRPPTKPTT